MAEEVKRWEGTSPAEAMRIAISEAQKAFGWVSPNPPVGCVILDEDSNIISTGYHTKLGAPHAEVEAISAVEDKAVLVGATLYVTLEPCAHQGRTPPCADLIMKYPFKRVVYGISDPNPNVLGRGLAKLRAIGIECVAWSEIAGLYGTEGERIQKELEELSEIFLYNQTRRKPFVAIKIASSLDGVIAMETGESKWITSGESRAHAHFIRSQYDAVLVGRKTFELDDPQLNIRLPGFEDHTNLVIVVDPDGKTIERIKESQLTRVRPPEKVFVVVDKNTYKGTSDPGGVQIVPVSCDNSRHVDMEEVLSFLWLKGVASILVEGGAHIYGSFLQQSKAQRLHLFVAPALIGGQHGIYWTKHFGSDIFANRVELKEFEPRRFGTDIYASMRLD